MAPDYRSFEAVHDIDALDHRVEDIQIQLRKILEDDSLAELIKIWRRPGWTTPAEFFLVEGALTHIRRDVEQLQVDIQHLVKGADHIGG